MSPEVLTHPEGHLSPSITMKTPAFILAYGPIATRKPSDPLHPFEYHVYLHYIPKPLETCSITYGNFPHAQITYLDLGNEIEDDLIARLDKNQLLFIHLATLLYTERKTEYIPNCFTINPRHLINRWIPPTVSSPIIYHWYPQVEILLKLTTHLIHEPRGQYAESFHRHHAERAKELLQNLEPDLPLIDLDTPVPLLVLTPKIQPDYVLAYGPFITPEQTPNVDHPFIY